MSSCLGIYVEKKLIKYAKVTKEHETLKVYSFGIKFYDNLGSTIDQIIEETSSSKTPISVNLSEEVYEYFYFLNLLSKNDLKKAVETEFDSLCYDKGFNKNALESRYALSPGVEDKEKIKAIYIYTNKTEINKKIQDFSGKMLSTITPLPMCMPNIAEIQENENAFIINIEGSTTITTVIQNGIYSVDKIDEGMDTILSNITIKENSYLKAYEICKNTTIYTLDGEESKQEENAYLEDIMPTLYSIVQKAKQIYESITSKIDKIYITGTGCVINNIDLYFQEFITVEKCEILKPYFISNNAEINLKDYIEVNSAIALAMQGLGYGINTVNFKPMGLTDSLPDWLKISPKGDSKGKNKNTEKSGFSLNIDWKESFSMAEKSLVTTAAGFLAFIIIYSIMVILITKQSNIKLAQVQEVKTDTKKQIDIISADTKTLNNKTSDYEQMTERLKKYNAETEENLRTKNAIPLLLTRIMNVIPKGVTLTSIENTKGTHIIINAQSANYDLLGFFKASLIIDGILAPSTVVSTAGVKQGGVVKVQIEGDLP